MNSAPSLAGLAPLDRRQIELRLRACPRLPSLSTINKALRELTGADQRYTAQVAEIIRRDPSLTARLLRLVNSVYYGLSMPVNSIEEAVFYLGVRQIRQLVVMTPIIEGFQKLASPAPFPWREFWQHCIATAILSREVYSSAQTPPDEVDYLAGLVHDVGKIVMASACPEHFQFLYCGDGPKEERDRTALEREVLGIDHAELGGLYLQSHNLPEVLVLTARFHHQPELAEEHARFVAAVQIANLVTRHAGIGRSGNPAEVSETDWLQATGWHILFPAGHETERGLAQASLRRTLANLPMLLDKLV
jgi:HD-like signal output (HDOD) protein